MAEEEKVPWDQVEEDDSVTEKSTKTKKKSKNIQTKTLVYGLIHLVKDGNKVKYLLKILDADVCIQETYNENGVKYRPKQDLPIEYISPAILGKIKNSKELSTKGLLNMLIDFIRDYLELPYEQGYLILALWVCHTYLIELFNVTPLLYFFGQKHTGKSRAGEVLSKLAFRGEYLTSPTEACLFRKAHYFKTCLLIDEVKLWGQDGNKEVARLIKSRYKRGLSVSRINTKFNGEDGIESFDVFAPLVICTNESIPGDIEDRSITFIMRQNSRQGVEVDIDEKRALEIRELLTVFRFQFIDDPLPEVKSLTRRRLEEITKPLHQVCKLLDPKRLDEFKDIVKYFEIARAREETETLEAEIITCLVREEYSDNRYFLTEDVRDYLNQNIDERDHYSSKKVAYRVKRLGFEAIRQPGTGKRGFLYDRDLISKIAEMYHVKCDG